MYKAVKARVTCEGDFTDSAECTKGVTNFFVFFINELALEIMNNG